MPNILLNETVGRKEEGLTRKEEFWETNYQYPGLNLQTLEVNDVFALYLKCNPRTQVNLKARLLLWESSIGSLERYDVFKLYI